MVVGAQSVAAMIWDKKYTNQLQSLNIRFFMNTNFSRMQTYIRPEMQVLKIETQSVLAGSGNPTITNPPMQWDTRKKDVPWSNANEEE